MNNEMNDSGGDYGYESGISHIFNESGKVIGAEAFKAIGDVALIRGLFAEQRNTIRN